MLSISSDEDDNDLAGLPRLVDGSNFMEMDTFHYLVTTVCSRQHISQLLEGVYMPFKAFMQVLDHTGVDIQKDTKPNVYSEIINFIKWRRLQPENVGSRSMPRCVDNEDPTRMVINWSHEFVRVCTCIAHVWTDEQGAVLTNQPQWTERRQLGNAAIPPAVVYTPAGDLPLPLLWFDYDPWKGTFDIPAHSWPDSMDPNIQIMLISTKEVGDQSVSKVLLNINHPADAVASTTSMKPSLTFSVTWIDPVELGDARRLDVPRLRAMCGIIGMDFGLLVTMSNTKRKLMHKLHSIYYCQGIVDNLDAYGLQRSGSRELQSSRAHCCPYSEWCYRK